MSVLMCVDLDDAKTKWHKVMPDITFDSNLVRILQDLFLHLKPLTKMTQDDLEVLATTNVLVYQLGWHLSREDSEMVIKQANRMWSYNQRQEELKFIESFKHSQ